MQITVTKHPAPLQTDPDGQMFMVDIRDGASLTRVRVTVSDAELERLGCGHDAETVVRESVRFLVERAPLDSLLGSFRLSTLVEQFAEFAAVLAERLETAAD